MLPSTSKTAHTGALSNVSRITHGVDQRMTTERNEQRSRAAQAGFVMRAYRESFVRKDGRRGLTQEELLRRMTEVDPDYEERFSHATVSRWESGATRPSASRLLVFGKALDLYESRWPV